MLRRMTSILTAVKMFYWRTVCICTFLTAQDLPERIRLHPSLVLRQIQSWPIEGSDIFHQEVRFMLRGRSNSQIIMLTRKAIYRTDLVPNPPTIILLSGSRFTGYREGDGNQSQFNTLQSAITLDNNHIMVTDNGNNCIRKISLLNGETSLFAGRPPVYGNDDGNRLRATFGSPYGIARYERNVFITSLSNTMLRQIRNETVTSIDTSATTQHFHLLELSGKLYFTASYGITEITLSDEEKRTNLTAGSLDYYGYIDGDAPSSRFKSPRVIVTLGNDKLLISEMEHHAFRVVDLTGAGPTDYMVYTVCANPAVGNSGDCWQNDYRAHAPMVHINGELFATYRKSSASNRLVKFEIEGITPTTTKPATTATALTTTATALTTTHTEKKRKSANILTVIISISVVLTVIDGFLVYLIVKLHNTAPLPVVLHQGDVEVVEGLSDELDFRKRRIIPHQVVVTYGR